MACANIAQAISFVICTRLRQQHNTLAETTAVCRDGEVPPCSSRLKFHRHALIHIPTQRISREQNARLVSRSGGENSVGDSVVRRTHGITYHPHRGVIWNIPVQHIIYCIWTLCRTFAQSDGTDIPVRLHGQDNMTFLLIQVYLLARGKNEGVYKQPDY